MISSTSTPLYRWIIYKLELKGKREEFQEEMAEDAEQFSELLEISITGDHIK